MSNKKILVIGSGAIVIGQACEFDYSGVQACKAFKEENYDVVLLNNNPATIMTDKDLNFKNYLEPLNIKYLKKIIKKENPKYIYPSVGGQTALNLSLELYKFKKYKKIILLGPNLVSIKNSESRKKFSELMKKNKIPVAYCKTATTLKEAMTIRKSIIKKTLKKTISIRPSYTLGGLGGGISTNLNNFKKICLKGLLLSKNNEVIIEESLYGYKEIEIEILIDRKKNFLVVCSIENIDPVGIHTGDSFCISPIQTITDKEYQKIRRLSFKIINIIGINSCGANLQFAINPYNNDTKIIEINPRLSRSSALASKATGYPIARIATKLSLGYTFKDLKNSIIKNLSSAIEPSLDYIVIKSPKFNISKFGYRKVLINNQMKSIGESMAISNNIESTIQKSLVGINNNSVSFTKEVFEKKNILKKIFFPNSERINNIYEAIKYGIAIKKINYISKLDCFFLNKIKNISIIENKILKNLRFKIIKSIYINSKKYGFSDVDVSLKTDKNIIKIINYRLKAKIKNIYKKIDSCSGEFETKVNYFYSTYENGICELNKSKKKSIIILGSGPNNIGQGIEFDYCCVHASLFFKKNNYNSIIINNNPETVSTDYDVSNKLFFVPNDFENLLDIYKKTNKLKGILIQFCGQLQNSMLTNIKNYKIRVIGTSVENINKTEDRKKFNKLIKKIKILQPKGLILENKFDVKTILKNINLPILIRPSFVLGGKGMKVIKNEKELNKYYFNKFKNELINFPILIDKYLKNKYEFDVDGLSNGKEIFILPVIQHLEKAGIHSGDSTSFLPSNFKKEIIKKIIHISKKICINFNIIGFFNIQYAYDKKKKKLYVLELNPRASRTIPFIIKSIGINIIKKCLSSIILGTTLSFKIKIKKTFIKEPVFSFIKYQNSDPLLGPEMKSTGELISSGKNIYEAYRKSQMALGYNLKKINKIFILCKKFSNIKINKILNKKINIIVSKKTKNSNFIFCKKVNLFKKIDKNSVVFIYYKNYSNLDINIRIFAKELNIPIYTTKESFKLFLKSL
ncbi:carbamoyl-phosphate synthase large subunit [Candidatus Vidania fulgoroideorum]